VHFGNDLVVYVFKENLLNVSTKLFAVGFSQKNFLFLSSRGLRLAEPCKRHSPVEVFTCLGLNHRGNGDIILGIISGSIQDYKRLTT